MELMNVPSAEQMKQFLYGELPEDVSQSIEERLFVDGDLFYELTNLENDLIDEYVRGRLEGEELRRFERSLARSDERRTQVENARALQRHITVQKKSRAIAAVVETTRPSLWSRLAGAFSLRLPAMQYAMAALIVLLGAGGAWLLYENRRVRQEFAQARLEQERRDLEFKNHVAEQERQIEALRQEAERQTGNEEALKEVQVKLKQREAELAEFKQRQAGGSRVEELAMMTRPTVRALDVRGEAEDKDEVVGYNPRSVTVLLRLTTEIDYKVYEIRKKNAKKPFTTSRKVTEAGKTYLLVTLPARTAVFEVWGIDRERDKEREIREYRLVVPKK